MNDLVKTLLTSGVVSGIVGGGVSWLTTSQQIEQELHSKQSESGYEALINANSLSWQARALGEEAMESKDEKLADAAKERGRKADLSYHIAQHKIAAFGDEHVVRALSDYYFEHTGAAAPCGDNEKFKSDVQVYKAIRNTLGVGGEVSDQQLAIILFHCSLK